MRENSRWWRRAESYFFCNSKRKMKWKCDAEENGKFSFSTIYKLTNLNASIKSKDFSFFWWKMEEIFWDLIILIGKCQKKSICLFFLWFMREYFFRCEDEKENVKGRNYPFSTNAKKREKMSERGRKGSFNGNKIQ